MDINAVIGSLARGTARGIGGLVGDRFLDPSGNSLIRGLTGGYIGDRIGANLFDSMAPNTPRLYHVTPYGSFKRNYNRMASGYNRLFNSNVPLMNSNIPQQGNIFTNYPQFPNVNFNNQQYPMSQPMG